jgi:hypothetical protein
MALTPDAVVRGRETIAQAEHELAQPDAPHAEPRLFG